MSTLTDNPNLDKRTRETIATIEVTTNSLVAGGSPAELAQHLVGLVGLQTAIDSATAAIDAQIADLGEIPPDDSFVIALRGVRACNTAEYAAITALRTRVEEHLQTIPAR